MKVLIKFLITIIMFCFGSYAILDSTNIDKQNLLPCSIILGMLFAVLSAIEVNTRKDENN